MTQSSPSLAPTVPSINTEPANLDYLSSLKVSLGRGPMCHVGYAPQDGYIGHLGHETPS